MDPWLDRMAAALGEPGLSGAEGGAMLRLAREVAHGVERRLAPLSTYLAGMHVGRRLAEGAPLEVALAEVEDAVRALIPPADSPQE